MFPFKSKFNLESSLGSSRQLTTKRVANLKGAADFYRDENSTAMIMYSTALDTPVSG